MIPQPRFIIIHAATGESMPPDMSTTTLPSEPTGRPPSAAMVRVETSVRSRPTSIVTVTSGWIRSTGAVSASWMAPPTCWLICSELSASFFQGRRVRTQ